MIRYVYPRFAKRDFAFFRVGGPGLANCLFIAAKAYLLARQLGLPMLRPTWERLGLGQFLRRERDKRFYCGLFRSESWWQKFRRLWVTRFNAKALKVVAWDRTYFHGLWEEAESVRQWVLGEILPEAIRAVPAEMKSSVAVHVRLGDFPAEYRTPIGWYRAMMEQVMSRRGGREVDFQIFSDGSDEELAPLLALKGARRVFYGNAIADMVAISRCGLLIGSDSTFSTWGAFLGQVPAVFAHLLDCPPHQDPSMYAVLPEDGRIPEGWWR